ncbi:hypothetical protein OIU77_008871 [Salix suchowensis]|uniref:Methyltransferase type 11 domain-containing protein n=1 Tax=Salix suchowensis TaxID=1278906 RepID=A0ABQ9ACF2_9ROSI|nr:hypothetical protein OIU77_008871 [Salix suchowensis]
MSIDSVVVTIFAVFGQAKTESKSGSQILFAIASGSGADDVLLESKIPTPLFSCFGFNLAMSLTIKPRLHHQNHRMHKPKSTNSRDWTQIYTVYGMEQWQTLLFLVFQATIFSIMSVLFLLYFQPICQFLDTFFLFTATSSTGGGSAARFAAGFIGCVTALSAVCLFFAAGNFFYSSVGLRYEMAQRIGAPVGLLGLDRSKGTTLSTLRTANVEGVGEYVTCREGDVRSLPFGDNYFDVVVSATFVHTVGKEYGHRTVEAAAERMRVLGEMVRVLKPGGVGVVWDLVHVPEYVRRLQELKMEDITVSERVTAFMVSSHIVSFRKPDQHILGLLGPGEIKAKRNEISRWGACHAIVSKHRIGLLRRLTGSEKGLIRRWTTPYSRHVVCNQKNCDILQL